MTSKKDHPYKICKVCKVVFVDSKHPNKFLCSKKCAGVYKRTIPFINCPTCGVLFRPQNSIVQHCSRECARYSFGKSKRDKIFTKFEKECEVCGKLFKTVPSSSQQFCCSFKCSGIRKRKTLPTKICTYCNKEFTPKKREIRTCSKSCSAKRRATLIKLQRKEIHKTLQPNRRIENRKILGNKCKKCGWDKEVGILELHHIDRNRYNNTIDNLQLLCPICHSLEHFKAKDGNYRFKK